jgi:tetratricopeptide (TPR) repeat protein
MGSKALRLACIILLVPIFPGAARRDTFKQEMRFGAEAAQRGLWREAAFRWEKILKVDPDNARVHNNLAVAYESLGQFDRARREYETARRLSPDRKEIRNNYESFLEFCRLVKGCGTEPQAAPGPGAAGPSPTPGAVPDAAPTPSGIGPLPAPSPGGSPGGA